MKPCRTALWAVVALALCVAPIWAQTTTPRALTADAEQAAKALLARYYNDIPTVSVSDIDRGSPPRNLPDDCRGVSLLECFGGDPECTPPFGRGWIVRHCESESLRVEREALLLRLDSLAELDPESDWIAGQRVYLAVKNGRTARAVEIAGACRASRWWCDAILGFAMHAETHGTGGEHLLSGLITAPSAAPAWDKVRAVGVVDRGVRCEWTDLTPLIPDSAFLADYHSSGSCGARQPFEDRFWWLADPFWSVPGNERLDEHIARSIQARFRDEILRVAPAESWTNLEDASPTPETAHTRERHAELLRVGSWNSWRSMGWGYSKRDRWSNQELAKYEYSASGALISDTIQRTARGTYYVPRFDRRTYQRYRVGYLNGGYSFTPDVWRFVDPVHSTAQDWSVARNEGHERMVTSDAWFNLEHQTGILLRGDSLLVVTAGRAPVLLDSLGSVDGALAMGRPADLHVEVVPAQVDMFGVARAHTRIGRAEWVASLELTGAGWRGRARQGATAPALEGGFGVSAPLLVEAREERMDLPIEEATLLPSTDLGLRDDIDVYLEIYGVGETESLDIGLSLAPFGEEPSLLERIGRALRLGGGPRGPVRLSWKEPVKPLTAGISTWQLTLDTGSLQPGSYQLAIEVRRPSGAIATSSIELRFER